MLKVKTEESQAWSRGNIGQSAVDIDKSCRWKLPPMTGSIQHSDECRQTWRDPTMWTNRSWSKFADSYLIIHMTKGSAVNYSEKSLLYVLSPFRYYVRKKLVRSLEKVVGNEFGGRYTPSLQQVLGSLCLVESIFWRGGHDSQNWSPPTLKLGRYQLSNLVPTNSQNWSAPTLQST